jgi:hypothetical protein
MMEMEMEKETFEQTGIEENERNIPLWFWIMCVALLAWGAYYLYKFWGGFGPGIGY